MKLTHNEKVIANDHGFCVLLGVLFIGLKLTHLVAWSWWWVLAPLWIPYAIGISLFLLVLVFVFIAALFSRD